MNKERLYTPVLRPDLVRRLYRLKLRLRRPMTALLAEAVETYLSSLEAVAA